MLFKLLLLPLLFFFTDSSGGGGSDSGDGDGDGGDGDGKGGDGKNGNGSGDDEVAGLKSALDKERKAARDATKALKAANDRLTALENKDKPEADRLTRERDDALSKITAAEAKLQLANGRSAVTEAAIKANAISPRAVFALVRDDLDYDDDGEPTNVDAVLARARKDEPSLFKASAGGGDGGKGGDSKDGSGPNSAINEWLRAAKRF